MVERVETSLEIVKKQREAKAGAQLPSSFFISPGFQYIEQATHTYGGDFFSQSRNGVKSILKGLLSQ